MLAHEIAVMLMPRFMNMSKELLTVCMQARKNDMQTRDVQHVRLHDVGRGWSTVVRGVHEDEGLVPAWRDDVAVACLPHVFGQGGARVHAVAEPASPLRLHGHVQTHPIWWRGVSSTWAVRVGAGARGRATAVPFWRWHGGGCPHDHGPTRTAVMPSVPGNATSSPYESEMSNTISLPLCSSTQRTTLGTSGVTHACHSHEVPPHAHHTPFV